MHLEKAKKRIAKKVKMGFQGYPKMSIAYFGASKELADEVVVRLVLEEGSEFMEERFQTKSDAREDESIQSALVKMMERCQAKTLVSSLDVTLKSA